MENSENIWQRLIEKTVGAVRHVIQKHGCKSYVPVGFSVVFYNYRAVDPEKKWLYDLRSIVDSKETDFGNPKLKERIDLVNEFLAHGVKKILEGEIDDFMVGEDEVEGVTFQIPGLTGRDGTIGSA